jgi:hypothetical protein
MSLQGRLRLVGIQALDLAGELLPTSPPEGLKEWWENSIHRRLSEDDRKGSLPFDLAEWFAAEASRMAGAGRGKDAAICEAAARLITSVKIDPSEVTTMLKKADAPEPSYIDASEHLAIECLTQSLQREDGLRHFDWEARRRGWRSAAKNASDLKRMLRKILEELRCVDLIHRRKMRTPDFASALQALEQLEFTPPDLSELEPRWQNSVLPLAEAYTRFVHPSAGWSENSAAVCFLVIALASIYPSAARQITTSAVRSELQRRQRRQAARRGQGLKELCSEDPNIRLVEAEMELAALWDIPGGEDPDARDETDDRIDELTETIAHSPISSLVGCSAKLRHLLAPEIGIRVGDTISEGDLLSLHQILAVIDQRAEVRTARRILEELRK